MAQPSAEKEANEKSGRNQWIMNCVLFGAQLFKKLVQGEIKKEGAIAEIKNLSSEIADEEAEYILKRLNDLIYR